VAVLTVGKGANAAMASLKTAETKVAYLIQMIALQLHKASKEIGSIVGFNQPFSQLPAHDRRRNPQTVPMIFDFTLCGLTASSLRLHSS